MDLPKIVEYNDAFFVDDMRIPFVIKNSISISDHSISVEIATSSYERIFDTYSVNSKEVYNFNEKSQD
ncbi:hypothetical protein MXZ81_06055 [Streptococcus uberis]|nr:hypothetical protein [Streptococcus uberis]